MAGMPNYCMTEILHDRDLVKIGSKQDELIKSNLNDRMSVDTNMEATSVGFAQMYFNNNNNEPCLCVVQASAMIT